MGDKCAELHLACMGEMEHERKVLAEIRGLRLYQSCGVGTQNFRLRLLDF
jgi:hypothetical protein